jgi:hypothetical protein
MAALAFVHRTLLLVGPGRAQHPFRIRELGGDDGAVIDLAELQIHACGLSRRKLDAGRILLEFVSGRPPNADGVSACRHAVPREAESAVGVAHDMQRDGRTFFGGADDNALHWTFLLRAYLACERSLTGRLRLHCAVDCETKQHRYASGDGPKNAWFPHATSYLIG